MEALRKISASSAPGLSVDMAYYRIKIRSAISRLSAQQTLADCYEPQAAFACSGIGADPPTANRRSYRPKDSTATASQPTG